MGYEYHNRRRNSLGQFDYTHHTSQIHVYCTGKQARTIRAAAAVAGEELSAFCRQAAMDKAKEILTDNGQNSINGE